MTIDCLMVYAAGVVIFGMAAAYRLGTHSDYDRNAVFTPLCLLVVMWPLWILSLPFYAMYALGDHVRDKRNAK